MPDGALAPATARELVRRVRELLGKSVDVAVEQVPTIPLTASGKFRYVTSRVANGYLDNMLGGTPPPEGSGKP